MSSGVVDSELLIKENTGIDGALGWWKVSIEKSNAFIQQQFLQTIFVLQIHEKEFPNLSRMAKDFLSASSTGVPVGSDDAISIDFRDMENISINHKEKTVTVTFNICLRTLHEFGQNIKFHWT